MPYQEPKNTLQQDLMLLAKNHYQSERLSKLEMAKRICAFHVLTEWSYFKTRDVAYWLMKEFVEPELILTNRQKLISFMMEHGKYALTLGGVPLHPKPEAPYVQHYFEILASELMSEITNMQVIKDDKWLMPFDRPEVDPYIQELLNEAPVEA